jgi:hypothetical protein
VRLYFFDKENMWLTNTFLFGNKFLWLLLVFILLILAQPLINNHSVITYLKDIILVVVTLTTGFILVKNETGRKAIVYGIILAGIISSFDLMFTFFIARTDSLGTIRLLDLLLGKLTHINHNIAGYMSSTGLLFIYLAWNNTRLNKILLFALGLLLLLGVLISTSRSALLAILIVLPLMSFLEPTLKHNLKKIIPLGILTTFFLIGFFFIYNIFLADKVSTYYVGKIYYRLYEEPMQILGGEEDNIFDEWTGQRIKGSAQNRPDMWRYRLNKFMNLSFTQQFLGLGPHESLKLAEKIYNRSGYVEEPYAPHNGYLVILLERGILGLILFIIIIISISKSAVRISKEYQLSFPFIYILLFLVIFSFGQNAELTNMWTYFLFGCVIGNIVYSKIQLKEDEIEKIREIQQTNIT